MSDTMLSPLKSADAIYIRDFLDAKGVPYILCQVDVKDDTKTCRKSTIPKGWTDWSYDECMSYNKLRADPKCSILNVNLKKGNLVVVDIDKGDDAEHFKKYNNRDMTKSIRRGKPHIWFEKQPDDYNTDITNVNDTGVDFRYNNVFEKIDGVMINHDGHLDEFDWRLFIGEKPKLTKKTTDKTADKTADKIADKINDTTAEPLLDLIKFKYWDDYDTWRNLVWACVDKFGMEQGIKIAEKYSQQSPKYHEGCVEKVAEYFVEGKITWGTTHHYAKLSDADAYYRITARKIKNSDEFLAHLFMTLRKDDIVCCNTGDYFYFKGNWKRLDEKRGSDFLKRMIYLTLEKEISTGQKTLINQLLEVEKSHGCDSELYEKLRKQIHILQDIIDRLEKSRGINEIYNKVKPHMSAIETDVLFDIGPDQYFNIQFKNGVYDLKTESFRPRTQKDFITHKLDWKYSPIRDEQKINEIRKFFEKIQPDKIQRDFTIGSLAQCLDGNIEREQFKMNIGATAGNGKSTEFSIHSKCFDIYSTFLSPKTFSINYATPHKQFGDFIYYPIRFACIEEPESSKQDENLFKAFVSGKKFPIDIMYGTKIVINLQATLNICANADANMNIDQGILRRGLKQNYKSEFREYYEDDPINHKYKAIHGWDKIFDDDEYKLAYFHLLLDYYKDFEVPEIFRTAFKDGLEEYDEFSNILDDHFEKTNKEWDKISKDRVMDIFAIYKITSWRTILSKMKSAGFIYNKAVRCEGKRGAFIGVKEIAMSASADEEEEGEY